MRTRRDIAAAVTAALAALPDETSRTQTKADSAVRPAYLRPAEAARFLGISRRHVSNLTRRGLLPVSRIGARLTLYAVADLEAAVASFRVGVKS